MNKFAKITIIFLSAALTVLLNACHKDDNSKPVPPTERTVLVYMVASNSLGTQGYDTADLDEMISAMESIPANTRWLVYHASSTSSEDATLMELTKQGFTTIHTYPQGESALYERMTRVINDTKLLAPASSYGLVLWSHASGWHMDGAEDLPEESYSVRPLSFGSDFGTRMNINTLAKVLAGQDFDYVYFDACYMGAAEVAYELRHATRYIVGSPSELPANGMPYDQNMALLLKGGKNDLINAAKNTFSHYNSLAGSDRTCTMGVYDTSAMDDLAAATKAIYAITPLLHPGAQATDYAGQQTRGFTGDLKEYVVALAEAEGVDPGLVANFNSVLTKVVLYSAATPMLWNRYEIFNSCGMSTYIFENPDHFYYKDYYATAWAEDVVTAHLH